jgi:hypothetical protein
VGYFFIPILNITYPLKVVKEIWNASDSTISNEEEKNWIEISKSKIVDTWWNFVLITGIINNATSLIFTKTDVSNIKYITGAIILSELTWIIAGIFAIIVIVQINKRQLEKYHSLIDQQHVINSNLY